MDLYGAELNVVVILIICLEKKIIVLIVKISGC